MSHDGFNIHQIPDKSIPNAHVKYLKENVTIFDAGRAFRNALDVFAGRQIRS